METDPLDYINETVVTTAEVLKDFIDFKREMTKEGRQINVEIPDIFEKTKELNDNRERINKAMKLASELGLGVTEKAEKKVSREEALKIGRAFGLSESLGFGSKHQPQDFYYINIGGDGLLRVKTQPARKKKQKKKEEEK